MSPNSALLRVTDLSGIQMRVFSPQVMKNAELVRNDFLFLWKPLCQHIEPKLAFFQ